MPTLLQADIFFFISSIGVVLTTSAIIIAAYYVIKAAEEVRAIASLVHAEAKELQRQKNRALRNVRFAAKWLHAFSARLRRDT